MSEEHEGERVETSAAPPSAEQPEPDPAALVARMAAAGGWPEPDLLQQIIDQGEAAVPPLIEVLKTRPRSGPQVAPVDNAIGLLGMLRSPQAMPALCDAARFYKGDTTQMLADAIASHGQAGFDALLNLIRDPAVSGYQRSDLIQGAKMAAGNDPAQRNRLAEVLRGLFQEVMAEARKDQHFENELLGGENGENVQTDEANDRDLHGQVIEELDEGQFDRLGVDKPRPPSIQGESNEAASQNEQAFAQELDAENELSRAEDLAFLAIDLAALADPLARAMIRTAFDEGLIENKIVKQGEIDETHEKGGLSYSLPAPWLEEYLEFYHARQEDEKRLARMTEIVLPTRVSYPDFKPGPIETTPQHPPQPPPVEPFRRTAPKLGRNEPCWCGSGKKYKKCHLGKDAPA